VRRFSGEIGRGGRGFVVEEEGGLEAAERSRRSTIWILEARLAERRAAPLGRRHEAAGEDRNPEAAGEDRNPVISRRLKSAR